MPDQLEVHASLQQNFGQFLSVQEDPGATLSACYGSNLHTTLRYLKKYSANIEADLNRRVVDLSNRPCYERYSVAPFSLFHVKHMRP